MTICPVAIAVGCQKCPLYKVCPLKSVLGDVPKVQAEQPVSPTRPRKTRPKTGAKAGVKSAPARKRSKQ